ncbi:MAG: pyridoxamine 5'-phosphate oxidase family protein [Candidatus Saccharimonadales bacterium]
MLNKITSHVSHRDELKFSDRNERIFSFLKQNPIGVLSTVTPNNSPHGTVVYFQINKDFTVSFLTKTETRKYSNLSHNNHVMLTVFEPESQAVAQVIGTTEEIEDGFETNSIAGTILGISMKTSEAGTPPISKLYAGAYVAMKITPAQIRMTVYARPGSGSYEELFESLESFELKDT